MKRLTTLLAIAVAAMATALTAEGQVRFGVGYNLETMYSKLIGDNSVTKDNPRNLNGFYVEASYNWDFLAKNWGTLSLQPGISYVFGGAELEEAESEGDIMGSEFSIESFLYDHYLNVPVNVRYSYDIKPGAFKVFASAGPVFSFGLASNSVVRSEFDDEWSVTKTNLYTGKSSMKTKNGVEKTDGEKIGYGIFDLKLGISVGAVLRERYELKLGYHLGMLNKVAGMNGADPTFRNVMHVNNLHFGFAYNF